MWYFKVVLHVNKEHNKQNKMWSELEFKKRQILVGREAEQKPKEHFQYRSSPLLLWAMVKISICGKYWNDVASEVE